MEPGRWNIFGEGAGEEFLDRELAQASQQFLFWKV